MMNLTEVKKTYSTEQVKDILSQLEFKKLRHDKRNPDNHCPNCGYNEDKMSIIEFENGSLLVMQYGSFSYSKGKTKCCECGLYC